MSLGKVFSFFVMGTRIEMLSGDCAIEGSRKSADAWLDAFSAEGDFEKLEACYSMNPRDKARVHKALENNTILLGAPLMGRLGSYNEGVRPRDAESAFRKLSEGLRKS